MAYPSFSVETEQTIGHHHHHHLFFELHFIIIIIIIIIMSIPCRLRQDVRPGL